ncbi:MAG: HipA N-terminal domain-containing protein [Lachnospiraceae bacterium]|nr:HipA N-terminal domain-containing protein [Lachnospiraceae bacterium]
MSTFRKAFVYIRDSYVGLLEETDEGYRFQYDPDYLACGTSPVSLTLPLTDKPFVSTTLFPFFDGLIPEGWLLEVVSRNWKIERRDRFGLLLIACRDAIGNVTIREERL